MTDPRSDYVAYRLALAREALEVARAAASDGHLHSAVNRLYYACFYAVSALLFQEGYTSTKHSDVRSLFSRHWVKPGRLPKEYSRFYRDLFNRRQQGDYDDFVQFSQDEVSDLCSRAQGFVDRLEQELRSGPRPPSQDA